MPTLYFNTSANPGSALVKGLAVSSPATPPVFVVGDNREWDIYLVTGAGAYDSISGDASYTLKIGVGTPGRVPTGGTYTITAGAATTSALAYGATAATIQTALNALNGGLGPYSDLVTVDGDFPNYRITWTTNGDRAAMTGTSSMTPDSAVVIDTDTAGSAGNVEIQTLRLRAHPAMLASTWATITDGWRGRMNFNTFRAMQFVGTATSVAATLEVEVTDGSGNRVTYVQIAVTVRNEVIDMASLNGGDLTSFFDEDETNAFFVRNQTGLSGLTGGSGYMDGIATASGAAAVGWFQAVLVSGNTYFYRLEAGTDAESSPTVIRPDDYATTTNEVVWKLKGIAYSPSSSDTFTYEAVTTITAAGNTDLVIPAISEHHSAKVAVTDTYGGGGFTHTITIPTTDATAGDVCQIRMSLPASIDPTIEIRNATSGGTLLTTFAGQSNTTAIEAYGEYKYTGSAWVEFCALYID